MSGPAPKVPHETPAQILDAVRAAVSANTAVTVTDPQGVITFVNARFCELSGFTEAEMLGATHAMLGSGLHHAWFFAEMWQTISQGAIWRGEICSRTRSGLLLWEDVMIVPVLGAGDAIERYVSIRIEPTWQQLSNARDMHRLAYSDQATGLANRSSLLRTLAEHAAHNRSAAACGLVTVSIDEYSTLNDAFGFDAGDDLMAQAATKLRATLGSDAFVSRSGPSTFGVLLPLLGDCEARADAACRAIIGQLREALTGPTELSSGVRFSVSTSVGYVLFSCSSAAPPGLMVSRDAGEIVKCAEVARKRARLEGGSHRVCRFSACMLVRAQDRVRFATELREGIERGQLRLHAQPIVDARRRVIGAEALVRWAHPLRGELGPGDFIALAEQTGAIVDLGAWVLERACETLRDWSNSPGTRELTLSINVSERELRADGFTDRVKSQIERHDFARGRLRIELTESMWQRDIAYTAGLLHTLHELGVDTALDDFGTGYSSLSYLRTLPVSQLKVDRSFVAAITTDERSAAVTRAIVDMAGTMGLDVVAEGVEAEGQFELLRGMGVDAFQGFLFARPMPIEELTQQLTQQLTQTI